MANDDFRSERDSLGELQVPGDALWGAQTQRAVDNFPISGLRMPRDFIRALGLIKWAAATANVELGGMDAKHAAAIQKAALEVADGRHDRHFPVDVFQTGSGTSSNMNANEVIARLASQFAGIPIHPNDHVNMSQSSNDVIPTAIQVSALLGVEQHLLPSLAYLSAIISRRIGEIGDIVKTGRTHLMDAMPVTFGQEMSGWRTQIEHGSARIMESRVRLQDIALGGTAVGTGVNAHPRFAMRASRYLSVKSGLELKPSSNYFEAMSSQDSAVELSGQLRTLAVSMMKIANDLRWMNSGPLAGLGEISLPALQPGSSIMPGKVNPVIPEAVSMVAAQVMGNDATIAIAGQSGNFQLNVMLPVIAYNLLQSIDLLSNAARVLGDSALAGFKVNDARIGEALNRNPILVTALNPVIGYEAGAKIAKEAYATGRSVKEVAAEHTQLSDAELSKYLDPRALTKPGGKVEGGGG
ncbi:class II fumarate hydratase [Steroidobacter sp.]|uniref:class II fumarate hydratase n=1 Tax=Steroidobacter sp. TaxID=1978227 RepID=UPI001A413599|nr:class II fumarate hydratase [Steroidobacter sp.]MBL8271100.1 class II fumarate hydratase [Steroidobacter sp.]